MLIFAVLGTLAGIFTAAFRRTQGKAPPPAEPRLQTARAASQLARNARVTETRIGSAGGLMLKAIKEGKHEPIQWVQVHVGGLVVLMARDALSARNGGAPLRLPVSYADTVEACRILGCIAPTKEICDAAYEASSKYGRLDFRGLVRTEADTARMTSLDFSEKFNAGIERQLQAKPHSNILAGPWKYWILHPRIVEKGAVNYGGWDASGTPIQTVGGRHDATHFDYSQLLQPVQRVAYLDGRPVDLIDHFQTLGIPRAFVEVYR